VVKLLIERGAEVNQPDNAGWMPSISRSRMAESRPRACCSRPAQTRMRGPAMRALLREYGAS